MAGKLDSYWPHLHPAAAPPDLIGQSSPLGQRYSHMGRVGQEKAGAPVRDRAKPCHYGMWVLGAQKARCHSFAQYLQEADSRCESGGWFLKTMGCVPAARPLTRYKQVIASLWLKAPKERKFKLFPIVRPKDTLTRFCFVVLLLLLLPTEWSNQVNNGYTVHTP